MAAGIDSARRKQLIDQRVAFVVPGNQVYLPFLGVDLLEHFRNARGTSESLSPATQAAFLYALHRRGRGAFSPKEMAAALGYSSMTMSRAFDELEGAGLGRPARRFATTVPSARSNICGSLPLQMGLPSRQIHQYRERTPALPAVGAPLHDDIDVEKVAQRCCVRGYPHWSARSRWRRGLQLLAVRSWPRRDPSREDSRH